ncbi:endolytic transglycosylase MltG [Kordia sp. YSTF-M3]|uniref:Endolytic murein transglycosylase n=1 Tax=Kordia aestuariivivens TaxID=2759037 RepID=A0ABR7QCM4_9FLAO|nr:endolytic transglycosylase MltG [Kordia aestuariivivens]MBC8756305.1 endolytic transglycosylase MltG [Kordia aestuariivivens]
MKSLKIIGVIILVAAIVVGIYFYPKASMYFYGNKTTSITKETTFYVPSEATFAEVLNSLKVQGIVDDVEKFQEYAAFRNLKQETLEAGKYMFPKNVAYSKILEDLRKGNGEKETQVTFNNARTKKELAEKIAVTIELTADDILKRITDEKYTSQFGFTPTTINTMFIPNTYNVYWDISADDLIAKLAKEYKRFWTADRKAKAKALNMSQTEVSVLASIVVCETIKMDEAPKIAGVYVNRIRRGIPLDADPTLKWVLGDFEIKRILNKDKELDSPYNTYKNLGLPPGPIYIPSVQYIDAVLNYEKHDYIFFCAKEDFSGYSNFAKTNRQHEVNARKYHKALNERKIYR